MTRMILRSAFLVQTGSWNKHHVTLRGLQRIPHGGEGQLRLDDRRWHAGAALACGLQPQCTWQFSTSQASKSGKNGQSNIDRGTLLPCIVKRLALPHNRDPHCICHGGCMRFSWSFPVRSQQFDISSHVTWKLFQFYAKIGCIIKQSSKSLQYNISILHSTRCRVLNLACGAKEMRVPLLPSRHEELTQRCRRKFASFKAPFLFYSVARICVYALRVHRLLETLDSMGSILRVNPALYLGI